MITNKMRWLASTLSIFLFFLAATPLVACSVAFWNNNGIAEVVARTMDLYLSDKPLIVVMPRGVAHRAHVATHPAEWVAKYGSVVVTAFHSSAVSDGINEKGLAAHLLYLHETQYPVRNDHIPGISTLDWVQYVLDNFSTVSEVVAHQNEVQIITTPLNGKNWPLHLAIEDNTGDSAIFEFIKGKLIIHHGHAFSVMTNEPSYNEQLANLKKYKSFGGTLPMPGDVDSLSRFVRASAYLKTLPQPRDNMQAIAGVLSVIRTVMVPFGAIDTSGNKTEDAWPTRWVSISDLTNKVYYFNSTTAPNVVWVNLNELQFDKGSPLLVVDPTNVHLVGDLKNSLKKKTI